MLIDTLIILAIITLVLGLMAGIVLLILGFNGARKVVFIRAGWIIVGILSIIITLAFIYISIASGLGIIILIFGLPLFIIVGQIFTLTYAISSFVNKKIKTGIVFLVINLTVVTTIIVLLVLFMTGIIPIRLM